jgi:alkylation response protein AidB-like acyl-CoA dehydrogenase
LTAAAHTGERVIIPSQDTLMYVIGTQTGRQCFVYPTGRGKHVGASAVIQGDRAYFGSSGGRVSAITWQLITYPFERKLMLWRVRLFLWGILKTAPEQRGRMWSTRVGGDVAHAVALAHDHLYAATVQGHVVALEPTAGEIRWTTDLWVEITAAPTVAGDTVMVGTADGAVVALQAQTGEKRWEFKTQGRIAGSIRPEGRAYLVEGRYRMQGRWDFASGIHHANWLMCTCKVMQKDGPRLSPTEAPEICSLLVPAESVTIKDTWSVVGMCGTGSHDFVVDDVFVPATQDVSRTKPSHEPGPLYDLRLAQVNTWTSTAANALGIVRGAMDAFVELATSMGSTMSTTRLRDRSLVQTRMAEAEAILSAARAYVITAVQTAWDAVCHGVPDPMPNIVQARLAIAHSIHEAVRTVDIVFHAAGTNAVYRKHPLERYFRDIHVAVQHGAALPARFESAGKILLGYDAKEVGW